MDIDEAIKGRRSVRKYLGKPVSEELIRQVLETATWAPSAKNEQQWRFTVLTVFFSLVTEICSCFTSVSPTNPSLNLCSTS